MQLLVWIVILTMLLVAVHFDIKTRKIPNSFNLAFAMMGLATVLCVAGLKGLLYGMVGVLLPVLCLMPLFAFGVIGAGDIKLIAAVGAFVGARVCWVVIYSFLSCGVYGLLLVTARLVRGFCRGDYSTGLKVRWHYTKTEFSIFVLCGVVIYMLRHNVLLMS